MGIMADLLGKSSMKDANRAADAQRAELTAGYGRARDNTNQGYSSADDILSGYEAPARRGYDAYADSIGLNGEQGYRNALLSFNNDPFRQGYQDAAARAVRDTFRAYNGRGMGNSGVGGAAVARTAADLYRSDSEAYKNRLMQFGNQGLQIGTARAGNMIDRGNRLADFDIGQATGNANIEGQRFANISAARSQGMNNLLGLVGGIGNFGLAGFAPGKNGDTAFGNMRKSLIG